MSKTLQFLSEPDIWEHYFNWVCAMDFQGFLQNTPTADWLKTVPWGILWWIFWTLLWIQEEFIKPKMFWINFWKDFI